MAVSLLYPGARVPGVTWFREPERGNRRGSHSPLPTCRRCGQANRGIPLPAPARERSPTTRGTSTWKGLTPGHWMLWFHPILVTRRNAHGRMLEISDESGTSGFLPLLDLGADQRGTKRPGRRTWRPRAPGRECAFRRRRPRRARRRRVGVPLRVWRRFRSPRPSGTSHATAAFVQSPASPWRWRTSAGARHPRSRGASARRSKHPICVRRSTSHRRTRLWFRRGEPTWMSRGSVPRWGCSFRTSPSTFSEAAYRQTMTLEWVSGPSGLEFSALEPNCPTR